MRGQIRQAGFSLVELGVAIIVIGLLLGLVVKGGEMIENARISSTVMQVKSYQSAVDSFRSQYKAWPGDFGQAAAQIAGCAVGTDGDGNGAVAAAAAGANDRAGVSLVTGIEATNVWTHLRCSGLAPSLPAGAVWAFGSQLPAASVAGGFEMYYRNTAHVFRLSGQLSATALVAGQGVDGYVALALDRKMDDGIFAAGAVQVLSLGACGAASGPDCVVMIDVQR